ncbi:MAG: ATP-binding cassette domain-containing protein, partial [Natronosporangium sp.]
MSSGADRDEMTEAGSSASERSSEASDAVGFTALLAARQVTKRYGSVPALDGADLTIRPGQIHALLGANGAGKSTLVKILAGVLPADGGTVELRGEPVRPKRPADAFAAGVATVFQDPTFTPDLTVDRNLRLAGVDRSRFAGWVDRLRLGGLDLDMYARDLPLPALRLLDLARALAHDPQLLVLDEITAALPGDQVDLVFSVLEQWRDQHRSVLFIT